MRGGLCLNIAKDIQSLTAFRRRTGDFMKQLKRSKRPLVLTVKGKAAAVVQDAGSLSALARQRRRPPMHRRASARAWRTRKRDGCGGQEVLRPTSKPGMAYLVNIAARAERDLARLYEEIDAGHSGHGP